MSASGVIADPPGLLERMRMCLADIGVDPGAISWSPETEGAVRTPDWLPVEVTWKAAQVADISGDVGCCLECTREMARAIAFGDHGRRAALFTACEMGLAPVQDCGVDRTEPP